MANRFGDFPQNWPTEYLKLWAAINGSLKYTNLDLLDSSSADMSALNVSAALLRVSSFWFWVLASDAQKRSLFTEYPGLARKLDCTVANLKYLLNLLGYPDAQIVERSPNYYSFDVALNTSGSVPSETVALIRASIERVTLLRLQLNTITALPVLYVPTTDSFKFDGSRYMDGTNTVAP